mgnify:FL=1
MKTWRLVFLGVGVLLSAAAFGASECAAVELKMSHFMPTKHAQHQVMAAWAERMEEVTDGKLQVTIFPGGALGKPPHQYDNAVKGITDIAFGLQSYTPGRFPLTSVMELPFLVPSGEIGARALWRLYEARLHKEYRDAKVLWLFMHGPGQIFTTKKQIRTLEDLKGLKLRSPGPIMSDVIKTLGAVPVTMPITQVYTGLERRTIDGVCGPWEIMAPFRLYEQCKYATEADIYSMTFFVVMNKGAYDELPADLKGVLDANIGESMSIEAGRAYDAADAPARKLSMDKGMEVYVLPEAERGKWRKMTAPVVESWVEEMESKGLPGKEVRQESVELIEEMR